jgi:hypothetical protein
VLVPVVPVAAFDPPSELALLPRSEPAAIGAAFGVLETGRSTAVPLLVMPGCVAPAPVEFAWGALGFAPLCAKALEVKAITAVVAAMIKIFFIVSSLFESLDIKNAIDHALFRTTSQTTDNSSPLSVLPHQVAIYACMEAATPSCSYAVKTERRSALMLL